MVTTAQQVRVVLADVTDPEIPVVTIEDLGILRDVQVEGEHITVTITPTYSGCPAMQEIRADVLIALAAHGWVDVEVREVLSPAWTTDWLTERGRTKLQDYGIAPPGRGPVSLTLQSRPRCPQCDGSQTELLSAFASTSCQSLWRCLVCREPFSQFKAH
ncbi:MAG: phenylacetate-CoA oxygenase subunit PaaJ [Frankiales bacterium]|nr:phenylacetate-CoA oxygenase subunit PaaJ [Frankiales bacterium]